MLPLRPCVSRVQSISLAVKLFSLRISTTLSNVKELDSYEDRNFLLKGRLLSSREETKKTEEKPYVLKVLNQLESQRTKLLNLTSKVLLYLNERGPGRGVECPVPQPSVFGTNIVWCRIPRKRSQNVDKNCEFNETWSSKEHEIAEGIQLVSNASCGNNDIACGEGSQSHFSSVSTVDDGDVCAVRLFSFIPGDLLCDVKWTTKLLVDLGTKIGNMHKIFKEFSQTSDFLNTHIENNDDDWDLRNTPPAIIQYCHALEDNYKQNLVQEIAQRFQNNFLPKLDKLDTQVIHGDLNEHNVIVEQTADGQVKIKGFIDFGELTISYRVLDVAIALAYTMIESLNHGMNVVHASGHVLKGYQSVYPLSSLEMDMLLEASKTRICHSLVMGVYNYKYVCPGNDYLIYGTENGWKVLDDLRNIPARDVVKSWKRSCLNQ